MSLKAGIIGLPNVGKSTLFNAITQMNVEAANYPFATIEPNVGVVELKDHRLQKIAELANSRKIIYATCEFIDIAGLVKGASQGAGLGNKFLRNIKDVDSIIHVVRCFEQSNITHVNNKIDPIADLEIINMELLLADESTLKKVLQRLTSKLKVNDKYAIIEKEIVDKILIEFKKGNFASHAKLNKEELKIIKSYNLLTLKPMLYVANINEEFIKNPLLNLEYKNLKKYVESHNGKIIAISAKIEQEISELSDKDQIAFLGEFGLKNSGINLIISEAFKLLNLSTYFTAGVKESRAWVFQNGQSAPECAGIIHTDFQRGFIKVEIISYEDYIKYMGEQNARKNGKLRLEGKTYIMQDADVCNFKFNV